MGVCPVENTPDLLSEARRADHGHVFAREQTPGRKSGMLRDMKPTARIVAAFGVSLLVAAGGPWTLGVAGCGAGATGDGLTRAQAEEAVRAHNTWRSRAGVPPLKWAADLAARAQTRASYLAGHGCDIDHGPLPADVGENMTWVGPLQAEGRKNELSAVTPTWVVDAWGAESADYSPERGTCAPNRQCDHYTQIVWATTAEVGCGMAVCPTLGQIWVCNYRPKGNIRGVRSPAAGR
jgi:pathogenesis-related protein 1